VVVKTPVDLASNIYTEIGIPQGAVRLEGEKELIDG